MCAGCYTGKQESVVGLGPLYGDLCHGSTVHHGYCWWYKNSRLVCLSTSLPYDYPPCRLLQQTGYAPFDSSAPMIFSQALATNYMNGEWYLSYLIIPLHSFFASRIPCALFQCKTCILIWLLDTLDVAALRSRHHAGQGGMKSVLSICCSWHSRWSGQLDLDVCEVHRIVLARHSHYS